MVSSFVGYVTRHLYLKKPPPLLTNRPLLTPIQPIVLGMIYPFVGLIHGISAYKLPSPLPLIQPMIAIVPGMASSFVVLAPAIVDIYRM